MSQLATRISLFVASPADTQEERDRLETVVAELNRGIAGSRDMVLELVRWETHVRPGQGHDAQDVINRQIPSPDILVAIFWKRLGTPTPRAESGTAEEISQAIARWHAQEDVEILVYFNQSPYTPNISAGADQIGSLLAFREKLQSSGLLVWEYNGVTDFEAKVREHLTAAIRSWKTDKAASASGGRAARWTRSDEGLDADIDVTRQGDVQGLVAELRDHLRERGFTKASSDHSATAILELLANARDHSDSRSARLEVETHPTSMLSLTIRVSQRRKAFDLDAALDAGRRAYQQGEREHGLVKVERLTSYLHSQEGFLGTGWSGVECSVFDLVQPAAGVFSDFGEVGPITVEFDVPKRWWLGAVAYAGNSIDAAMRFALSEPAPLLLDLYFRGLQVPEDGYLGISFSGNVLPSEVFAEPIGAVAAYLPQPRSSRPLEAALEVYHHSLFESKRVVMCAVDPESTPTWMLKEWADLWDLPLFTSAKELRSFLARGL